MPRAYLCPSRLSAPACGVAVALVSAPAYALGENGEPIDTSQYTIDIYEGPNLMNSRLTGMAGASAPLAVGVQAFQYNPSSVAARDPWSTDWFDWEIDGGITLPGSVTGFDFDNNGDDSYASETSLFGTVGGRLLFGDFAMGLSLDLNAYQAQSLTSDQTLNVNLARLILVGGYSLFDGELLLGLGLGANVISLNAQGGAVAGDEADVGDVSGISVHAGATWAPDYAPIRVGAGVRLSPPAAWLPDRAPEGVEPDENGNYVEQGYILPRTISPPTEFHLGVGLQLFRPYNFRWVNPKDETNSEQNRLWWKHRRERLKLQQTQEEAYDTAKKAGATDDELDALEAQHDGQRDALALKHDQAMDKAYDKDRARRLRPYKEMPREKLLVTAAVKVTAITTDGVGVESFLRQEVERSGELVSVSPRIGVETEAVPGYLVLRGGSYYEPTRFRTSTGRVHGTGGLDVHIPIEWSVFGLFEDDSTFRVGGAIDAADRYFGWGVSAGLWH